MERPEIIYNQYHKKIYNLAYRMTGNTHDASDVTQDTFVMAFKSMHTFKGESDMYTWLYAIARNNCLKLLQKRNKSTFTSMQELINKASSPVSEEIPESDKSTYIAQVKDGCLSGLLCCLSLQPRLAFILIVLLELPVAQAASVMEKSENATRILVHRAKQAIREFLCSNCSLYDSANACRCENLINFSLKQQWIGIDSNQQLESEIKDLKNVTALYKTLTEAIPSVETTHQLKQLLANHNHPLIFTDKKVK